MAIKNFSALKNRTSAKLPSSSNMPAGRYMFTVTNVILSNTDNDYAIYVNFKVHGDKISNTLNVRFEPQLDSNSNWASVYTAAKILSAAAGKDMTDVIEDLVGDCIEAFDNEDAETLDAKAEQIKTLLSNACGVNFTGQFDWTTSTKNGRSYMNLRTYNKDSKSELPIELDRSNEPVDSSDDTEFAKKPTRTLTKVKR